MKDLGWKAPAMTQHLCWVVPGEEVVRGECCLEFESSSLHPHREGPCASQMLTLHWVTPDRWPGLQKKQNQQSAADKAWPGFGAGPKITLF